MIDPDTFNIGRYHIANSPHKKIGLGVEFGRTVRFFPFLFNFLPESGEIGLIALDLGFRSVESGCSQDESEFLRKIERVEDFLRFTPFVEIFEFPRDAVVFHIGHHHEIAPGNGRITRQSRSFGSDAFLDDLDDDSLPLLQAILNRRAIAVRRFPADRFGIAMELSGEVHRMEIGDMEETISSDSEIDERRLNRRFDIDDRSEIDVSDVQVFRGVLKIELFENAFFEDCNAAFLTLHVVDNYLLFLFLLHRARALSCFRAQSKGLCRRRWGDREWFRYRVLGCVFSAARFGCFN